jgi:hypothetical protein
MTTYTTTAIATSSVDNTVTVASISNMIPGLPITFSGTTFGGITTGSTYYIGTITYGYPTSKITVTSLPGGAVFALTTASGSMTANWTSGGQQILVTTPPGENLNTAFTKINTNFDQLWAAGPVNSNVRIADNTIYTLNTNGNLILNPNGIGNVIANAHVIPDTTLIRNLGSPDYVWNELYVNYLSVNSLVPSQITIPVANLHILGGTNHNFLQTDGEGNLSWANPVAAAGGNNTQIQFNNNTVLDGSDTFTFNSNTSTVTIQNVTTTGVANLNYVGNVQIAGGSSGYVLQTDGFGNLSWTAQTGNIRSILDQQFYGDNSNVNFNLTTATVTNAVMVSINGVLQIPGVAYTVNTDIITFAEAPLSTDLVDIRFLVFGEAGNATPAGADGFIQFNSGGSLGASANLKYIATTGNLYSSNVSVSGNITATSYYGDGSHLTGVAATANTGTITFANNVISTNNANAAIEILGPQQTPVLVATGGNSAAAQLLWATNIGALTPAQINNGVLGGNTWGTQISLGNTGAIIGSNSVAGLKTWTFRTDGNLSSVGGIIAGTIQTTDGVSAAGNITGNYILGNVAFATGIPQAYGNSNVYALLNGSAANIVPLANVSYSLGNATNQWKDLWVSNSTIYMNSVPITLGAGNVLSVAGNAVITSNNLGNTGFVGNAIYNSNGIYLENANLTTAATAAVLLPPNGSTNNIQVNNSEGGIVLQAGSGDVLTSAWHFDNVGNITLPSGGILGNTYGDNNNAAGLAAGPGGYAVINSYDRAQYVQADDSNVYIGTSHGDANWIWTFDPAGNITLPSNVANINYANGVSILDGVGGGGNPFNQDLNTSNSVTFVDISASGNISANGTITTTGTGGDLSTSGGNIYGANYITGNFFVGDGGLLSNVQVTANTGNITFNNSTIVGPSFGDVPSANSSVYIQPTVDSANVFQFSADGNISATGNIGLVTNSNLWNFDTNGTLTLPGNTLQLGLIGGDTGIFSINSANVAVNADGNTWTFDYAGNLTLPTNTSSINYANGAPYGTSSKTGSWIVSPGSNSVSITLPGPGTYSIWVNGNIPNGIVTYTATIVLTNNNVPVLGSQYGWYYAAGNALVLTSMPNQVVGTAGSISTATVSTTTANVFTFGITNNSGSSKVINWGYTQL